MTCLFFQLLLTESSRTKLKFRKYIKENCLLAFEELFSFKYFIGKAFSKKDIT